MCKQAYKNLENKMKVIKHDISKFARCHGFVDALNELGISIKNTLQNAYNAYKQTISKNEIYYFKNILLMTNYTSYS